MVFIVFGVIYDFDRVFILLVRLKRLFRLLFMGVFRLVGIVVVGGVTKLGFSIWKGRERG